MDKVQKYHELKKSKLLKDNPFLKDFYISVSILKDDNNYIKDPNENDALYTPKVYHFERQINSKVFRSKHTKQIVLKLNSNAKDLLWWIMFELQVKTDYIIINKTDCSKDLTVSVKTVERALKTLCSKEVKILSKSKEVDVYYLNPIFFFSGNRTKKYPQKCKEYKPK